MCLSSIQTLVDLGNAVQYRSPVHLIELVRMHMKIHTQLTLISFSLASGYLVPATATQQYFLSRSDAMGGTGVASAHYLSAPLINPALLARFSTTDNVGLLLPAIGAQVTDDGSIERINNTANLIDELDQYNFNSPQARATAQQLASELELLDNSKVPVQLGLAAVLAVPSKLISFAIFTNSYLDLQVSTDVADSDIEALRSSDPTTIGTFSSTTTLSGVGITDAGISLATKIELANIPVYIGISPKLQGIGFYQYSDTIDNFNLNKFESNGYINDNIAFNLDAGIVIEPSQHFTLGLVTKNINQQQVTNISKNFTYKIEPQVTAGFALHTLWFTAAIDLDMTQSNTLSNQQFSQYTRIGAEMDAWGWLQFRGGYRYDLEGNDSNQITFGMGLSPFAVIHFDITGMLSADDSYGMVAQTSVTF